MLLAALALAYTDPAGDAQGNGYVLPSRPAVQAEALDIREFQVQDTSKQGLSFRVSYGAVQNPWQLPAGFSAGVTDIFVKTGPGGSTTLPGLGLNVSGGWNYHLRISGAGSTQEQWPEGSAAPVTGPAPQISLEGTTLVVQTNIPDGEYSYWLTSSVYSPLSADGLLKPTPQASSSGLRAAEANAPVPVDVLNPDGHNAAYTTHLLAAVGQTRDLRQPILLGGGLLGLALTLLASFWLTRQPGPNHRAGQKGRSPSSVRTS